MDYNALAKQYGAVDSKPVSIPVSGGVDYSALAKKYGAVDSAPIATQVTDTSQPGGFMNTVGNFAKGLISAPATMIARPIQAVAELAGASAEDVNKFNLGGIVAPVPENFSDVKKDVGRGIQTVAMGTGAPIAGGAAFGLGSSLEQGNDLLSAQTALQTVMGAGAGKVLDLVGKPLLDAAGKVIGTITPKILKDVASKGAGAVSDFMAQHELLGGVVKPLSEKLASGAQAIDTGAGKLFTGGAGKAGEIIASQYPGLAPETLKANAEKKLATTYEDLAMGQSTSKQKTFLNTQKVTDLKNLAGTEGLQPQEILAKAHIVPNIVNDKLSTIEQAAEFRNTATPLQEANKAALQEIKAQTPEINLNDEERKALELVKTPKNINNGTVSGLQKEISAEYAGLRANYGDTVPITVLDDIKSARWQPIKFDKVDATRPLLGDANYAIAKTAQKTIEDTAASAGHTEVAQLNRHIGDIMEGAKLLESLNNKTVKGGGLTKTITKLISSNLGTTVPTKILGYLGGDMVANAMISNEIAGPVQRLILKNVESKEGPAALKVTMDWLTKQQAERAGRLALPEGNIIFKGPTQAGQPYTPNRLFGTTPAVETKTIPRI